MKPKLQTTDVSTPRLSACEDSNQAGFKLRLRL